MVSDFKAVVTMSTEEDIEKQNNIYSLWSEIGLHRQTHIKINERIADLDKRLEVQSATDRYIVDSLTRMELLHNKTLEEIKIDLKGFKVDSLEAAKILQIALTKINERMATQQGSVNLAKWAINTLKASPFAAAALAAWAYMNNGGPPTP